MLNLYNIIRTDCSGLYCHHCHSKK